MRERAKSIAWFINLGALGAFFYPFQTKLELIEDSGHAEIHLAIYAFLFLVFKWAKFRTLFLIPLLILQGVAVEYLQPFFGRGFAYGDMLGNGAGVILGQFIYSLRVFFSTRSTGPSK